MANTLPASLIGRGRYVYGAFANVGDATEPLAVIGPQFFINVQAATYGGNIILQMRPRLPPVLGGDANAAGQVPWQQVASYASTAFTNGGVFVLNAGADFEYQLVASVTFTGAANVFIGGGQVQ